MKADPGFFARNKDIPATASPSWMRQENKHLTEETSWVWKGHLTAKRPVNPELLPHEKLALKRYTDDDWCRMIRMVDRGASGEKLQEYIEKRLWGGDASIRQTFNAEHFGRDVSAKLVASYVMNHHADVSTVLAEQAKPVTGVLLRGLKNLTRDQFVDLAGRNRLRLGAITSATRDTRVMEQFITSTSDRPYSVLLELRGARGVAVEHLSLYAAEREVLLPKGDSFRVRGRYYGTTNGKIDRNLMVLELERVTK
jgi:hypothetical protein